MPKNECNAKQQLFCVEYLKDFNGTRAAIRAGYSEKTAARQAFRLLQTQPVIDELAKLNASLMSSKIADVKEIKERLTSMIRGEATEDVIVIEGIGEGYSQARTVTKKVAVSAQLKAAELLGKSLAMYVDKVALTDGTPTIVDDIPNEPS